MRKLLGRRRMGLLRPRTVAANVRPIGVFDSGLGGLTVVRQIRRYLPGEDIVYFGDTARVPYGTKSRQTVLLFARQNCRFLLRFDPKLIVVACNTASANALEELTASLEVPICGVVAPGAARAVEVAAGRTIAVIGTEATINSQAYRRAIQAIQPDAAVVQQACPLLVPLAEEGRTCQDPIVRLAVAEYLAPIRAAEPGVLVMGCTHYPLFREAIAEFLDWRVLLVDSGEQTAGAVAGMLGSAGALSGRASGGTLRCYVSDNPQRFSEVGSRFLAESIRDVCWISAEEFFEGGRAAEDMAVGVG